MRLGVLASIAIALCLMSTACSAAPAAANEPVTEAPSPTLSPTASARTPQLAVTEWIWKRELSNDQTTIRAEGLVQNTSDNAVERAAIYFVLRDAEGRFLGSESATVYQELAPNELYPWDFSGPAPDEVETLEVFSIVSEWADTPRDRSGDPPAVINEWAVRQEGSSSSPYVEVQGTLENVSERALSRVEIHVVFRAANGRFLAVESGYAVDTPLEAGQVTLWSVTLQQPPGFARAEIAAVTWDWVDN